MASKVKNAPETEQEQVQAAPETEQEQVQAAPETEQERVQAAPETGLAQAAPEIPQAERKETLLIPLDPNGSDSPVYICVNGRNMMIRRGEPVGVPAAFAEAYRNSQAQQLAAVQAQRAAGGGM